MRLISARDGFWSDTELAVRDAIKDVDLTGEQPSSDVAEADFLSDIANKKVLLLVHGYNNEPEDVHYAYDIVETHVAATVTGAHAYDRVVGYIWPGGDDGVPFPPRP